jgi:uncharacterized protein YbaP (TraB family)
MIGLRVTFVLLFVLLAPQQLLAEVQLYRITTADGSLTILGGTEVPDTAWLTASLLQVVHDSDTLWVEIPPEDPVNGVPRLRDEVVPRSGAELHPVAVELGYGRLAFGDYFDVAMGERSVIESQRLNLDGSGFRAMEPWLAYYTFNHAFWDQQNLNLVKPEEALVNAARAAGVRVQALFADRAEYYRFMGRMSDFAQTHYFQSLYNIIDWQRAGDYASRYAWTTGNPDGQWIEKFRTQTPDFYRYMYQRRNSAIAEQLLSILAEGGNHFLYLDVNRLLGPDSLLNALQTLGVEVREL